MTRTLQMTFTSIAGALIAIVAGVLLTAYKTDATQETQASCDTSKSPFCIQPRLNQKTDTIQAATIPKIATPAWMVPEAESATRVVGYQVATRGTITADFNEFSSLANQTLNDPRGWSRLGVRFEQVQTGGEFTLYISEASQLTTFSANGCDTTYSCNVGNSVVINQDRWLGATPSWTEGGGSLADYRNMVVNHETGHWLGHGHTFCSGAGKQATVMQQQSISLQGCTINAWPLATEMYSPKLGIRS